MRVGTVWSLILIVGLTLTACAKKEEVKPPTAEEATIVGKAKLAGETDFSGITVSIEALGISTTTNPSGDFKLSGLTEGIWVVKFEKEGYVPKTIEVTITGVETKTIEPVELEKAGIIRGKITISEEVDLSGIDVTIQELGISVKTRSDGSFEIKDLPAGTYTIVAKKTGYKDLVVEAEIPEKGGVQDLGELSMAKLPRPAGSIFYDDFSKDTIAAGIWKVSGNGQWIVKDGVVSQINPDPGDPSHLVLVNPPGIDWTTLTDYIIQAKVRVDKFTPGNDASRMGVAVRWTESTRQAWNFLFHQDKNRVQFLSDLVAWGAQTTLPWELEEGKWYWFKMMVKGRHLWGKVWRDGEKEPAGWTLDADAPGGVDRPFGPAALNGNMSSASTGPGNSLASYDEVAIFPAE
jgi:hypothetical protein